jgi:hypothetical protein
MISVCHPPYLEELQTFRDQGWIVRQTSKENRVQLVAFEILKALNLTSYEYMIQRCYHGNVFNLYLPPEIPEEMNLQFSFAVNLIGFLILSPTLTGELLSFDLVDSINELSKPHLTLPKKYENSPYFKSIIDEGTLRDLKALITNWKLTIYPDALKSILEHDASIVKNSEFILSELIRRVNRIKSIFLTKQLTPETIVLQFGEIRVEEPSPESSPSWDCLYCPSPYDTRLRRPRGCSTVGFEPHSPRRFLSPTPPPTLTSIVPLI